MLRFIQTSSYLITSILAISANDLQPCFPRIFSSYHYIKMSPFSSTDVSAPDKGKQVLPNAVRSRSTSSSSKTAEASDCERSSRKTSGDGDSILDSNDPPTPTDNYDVDSESGFPPCYDSEVDDESCFDVANHDNLFGPRSYPPSRPFVARLGTLIAEKPLCKPLSPIVHQFLVIHFSANAVEATNKLTVRSEAISAPRSVDAAFPAKILDGKEGQQRDVTKKHLSQLPQSVSPVYEQLFGCRWTSSTDEEREEVRLAREQPTGVSWEHSYGPFGYESAKNSHQLLQSERHQVAQIEWYFLKLGLAASSDAVSQVICPVADHRDFVERVERKGKIELDKARYQIGMKGFLRLNC